MNKETFKKFWFVILMAIALFVFIIYYSITVFNNKETKIEEKIVDGKKVIYSFKDEYYFADDLFEVLDDSQGSTFAYNALKREVIDKLVKSTTEMENTAGNYAAYIIQTYGDSEITSYLKQSGYTKIEELSSYYVDQLKENKFTVDFYNEHKNEYIDPLLEENNPRKVYHILIKVADVEEIVDEDDNVTHIAHPTEEEKEKLDKVLEALETKTFKEVAVEFSEDSSAEDGGFLGVVGNHNKDNYVTEFKEMAMSLGFETISEVITTQYGYHILYNEDVAIEDLLQDSTFHDLITKNDHNAIPHYILEKAKELGLEILDKDMEKRIIDLYKESEADE